MLEEDRSFIQQGSTCKSKDKASPCAVLKIQIVQHEIDLESDIEHDVLADVKCRIMTRSLRLVGPSKVKSQSPEQCAAPRQLTCMGGPQKRLFTDNTLGPEKVP